MKTAIRLAWLALIAFFAAASNAQEAVQKNYALVIGINAYPSISDVKPLKYAVNDAKAVEEILRKAGYEVYALYDFSARRETIITALAQLSTVVREQDTVLIYFAGHGVRRKIREKGHSFWLTADAAIPTLETAGIRLSHLMDYVADLAARRKIVILDHCHSGDVEFIQKLESGPRDAAPSSSQFRNAKSFAADALERQVSERISEGLVVLGAAAESSYEFEELKHGVFTDLLIKALTTSVADSDANGRVSVMELKTFMDRELPKEIPKWKVPQTPVSFVKGTNLDWDLLDVRTPVDDFRVMLRALTDLGDLSFDANVLCRQALGSWETALKRNTLLSERDQRVIEKLRDLRNAGDKYSWREKAAFLEDALLGRQR